MLRLEREASKYSEAYTPVDAENMDVGDLPDYIASNLSLSLPMTGDLMATGLAGGLAGKTLMAAGVAGTVGTGGLGTPATAPLTAAGAALTAGTIEYTAHKKPKWRPVVLMRRL